MAQNLFVLDCSVALSWCFLDEQDPYALDVLRSMAKKQAIVPAIFPLELSNGLLMGERRKRSTEADTTKWLLSLASLPIDIDSRQTSETFTSVIPLARAHGMTSYDASYLELALRRSIPFATMEPKLRACANVLGVKLYQPKPTKRTK
jgi:predicted nucleic acid-binding protein